MADRELVALKRAYGVEESVFARLWRGRRDAGAVTYCVIPAPSAFPSDQRIQPRRRTRLRSAKVLDRANRFLIDATIIDRSNEGLRLRLARDGEIPERFRLFDDEAGLVLGARLIWRRQAMIGVRIDPGGPLPATPREIASLRGKFYAMRD
jgi:hypothetical protein